MTTGPLRIMREAGKVEWIQEAHTNLQSAQYGCDDASDNSCLTMN